MKFLSAKIKRFFVALSNLPRSFALIWSAGKIWVSAQILLLLLRGVIPAAIVYLTKLLVDSLLAAVNGKASADVYRLFSIAAIFGGLMLLSEILSSLIQMVYAAHAELLTDRIFELIHEKSISADLAYYEQTEFFDHLHRARNQAYSRPQELTGQLGGLLQNSVTMISMGLILLRYGVWLPVVLLLTALPTFYAVLSSTSRMHGWQKSRTAEERKTFYYDRVLTTGEFAAELRLFGLGDYFKKKFTALRFKLQREKIRLAVRQRALEFAANFIALALTAAIFGWIVSQTLQGSGTVGDLALFYQIYNQGQTLLRSFLGDIGRLYSNGLFLGDLYEFLDLEPKIVSPPNGKKPSLKIGINVENVCFSYQAGKQNALENFSLFIPANKIVAVVGANGAGKSTLLKLICRFYDPQSGKITFDGDDVRELSLEDLRSMISVLFQTPVRYSATAAENIALGNIIELSDSEKIEAAASEAGVDAIIRKFPQNYAQMLSHRFAGGDELSVGEWQRIALARAIFREAQLILLDEPTSAMDPWAEADWLERFVGRARGKTVLLITHRFTTARRADLIYVMQNGAIVESGDHTELLRQKGLYASSWQEQIAGLK